jgi:ketosteroid isomerase-like protein
MQQRSYQSMNRNALSITLALAVAIIGLASMACAPSRDTNRDASLTTNRNVNSPSETFNVASIEAELKKMEQEWANAYKTKDVATVKRILADDVTVTYPDGTLGTKETEVQFAETGAFSAVAWETHDEKVKVLDADAAFMTGRTVIKEGKLKDPKTQKMIDISGEYRFLDVYTKRSGNWQVIASQVTKIAEPGPPAPPPAKATPTTK